MYVFYNMYAQMRIYPVYTRASEMLPEIDYSFTPVRLDAGFIVRYDLCIQTLVSLISVGLAVFTLVDLVSGLTVDWCLDQYD